MQYESEALSTASALATALSQSLAPAVDPRTVSRTAKLPFNVLVLRELLAYRVAELSTSACDLFRSGRMIAVTSLTRGALEGIAWLFVLERKISACLDRRALGTFGTFLNRLLLGSREAGAEHEAYNVLNALDEIGAALPGFRDAYDRCSEFAHPNADGMIHSYGRMDRENRIFNLDAHKYQIPVDGIVPILAGGLEVFIHTYNNMPPRLIEFAKLCEGDLMKGEA